MPIDVLTVVRGPQAEANLCAYFADSGEPTYTGRRFDRLDGGGDRPDIANTIIAADVVAVTMLSVQIPAPIAIDLLEGQLGADMAAQLAKIPTDVELGTEGAAALIQPGSHADKAWSLLNARTGIGSVTAGKLFARKRPHLIPVWDGVLRCQLNLHGDVWRTFDARLAANGGELRTELAALRQRTSAPLEVSLIRILDVVLWMRHHKEHQKSDCSGAASVSLR